LKGNLVSTSDDPQTPSGDIPPIQSSVPADAPAKVPPIIQDDNPFTAPKTIETSPLDGDRQSAAPLGVGYWACVAASVTSLLLFATVAWEYTLVPGWIIFFAAIRVPLRDSRRHVLNYAPTVRRMLWGAGDYMVSAVLCAGITLGMCTIFVTVCTGTALGFSALNINESTFLGFAFGIGGVFALVAFLLLYVLSLRI